MRPRRWLLKCCVVALFILYSATAAPSGCPQYHWAVQHAAWQSAEGANASRLTWVTLKKSPGGWGDRMRGSLLALRVAAANNRTLYLQWGGRHALAAYLEPATFDWRPPRNSCHSDKCYASRGAKLVIHRNRGRKASFDKALAAALATGRDIVVDERYSASFSLPLSGAAAMKQPTDYKCAWAVLYAPTAELVARGEAELAALNMSRPYAAVHLRLGGLVGEPKALGRLKGTPQAPSCPLALAHAATYCAAALRDEGNSRDGLQSSSGHRSTVLVITDNTSLRGKLARGLVDGTTGPNYSAAHVALAHGQKQAGRRWDAWLDLYMLANAAQLLSSHSGFSNMAAWWSNALTRDVSTCIRADTRFEGVCERERSKSGSKRKP